MKANTVLVECGVTYVARGRLGLGLFAAQPILSGEEIVRFSGEIIDFLQAKAKNEKECWPLQIGPDRYIDLQEPGCFANHSCNPNSGVNDRDGIVRLVAVRDILTGEEIRYDYSTTMDEKSFQMDCLCNEPQCRSVVTDFRLLPPLVKKAYLRAGVVMQFIRARYERDL